MYRPGGRLCAAARLYLGVPMGHFGNGIGDAITGLYRLVGCLVVVVVALALAGIVVYLLVTR